MPISKDLLLRLDAIINETHIAIDELDPDGKEAELIFGPVNDLGYTVDQLLTLQKDTPDAS